MAGELNISISLTFSKSGSTINKSYTDSIDVAGNSFQHSVQTLASGEETLTIHGDIGTVGYVFIKNLDATNFVSVGRTTGVYTAKLLAGEANIFRLLSGTSIYVLPDTGSVDVEYIVIEV